MFTLHKLPEGFIITSDETPNEGNTIFNLNNFEVVYNWQGHGSMDWWKKVIASSVKNPRYVNSCVILFIVLN